MSTSGKKGNKEHDRLMKRLFADRNAAADVIRLSAHQLPPSVQPEFCFQEKDLTLYDTVRHRINDKRIREVIPDYGYTVSDGKDPAASRAVFFIENMLEGYADVRERIREVEAAETELQLRRKKLDAGFRFYPVFIPVLNWSENSTNKGNTDLNDFCPDNPLVAYSGEYRMHLNRQMLDLTLEEISSCTSADLKFILLTLYHLRHPSKDTKDWSPFPQEMPADLDLCFRTIHVIARRNPQYTVDLDEAFDEYIRTHTKKEEQTMMSLEEAFRLPFAKELDAYAVKEETWTNEKKDWAAKVDALKGEKEALKGEKEAWEGEKEAYRNEIAQKDAIIAELQARLAGTGH